MMTYCLHWILAGPILGVFPALIVHSELKRCAPRISSGIYFFKHKLIIIGLDWIGELAKYCDERVCLWVGLSVCQSVREHISETTWPNFITFSWHVAYVMAVARYSFSDKIAIRYILPVL